MKLSGATFAVLVLGTLLADATHARQSPLVISYGALNLVAHSADPLEHYDVDVIGAHEAFERIRTALRLLERKSTFTTAAIDSLTSHGQVTIIYDPGFPAHIASKSGTLLAAYIPGRNPAPSATERQFQVVVGRYIVKWNPEGLAATLVHELAGHATQDLQGRLSTMTKLDAECEAQLYKERSLQDLGVDKRSREVVQFRRALQWHWCVPFRLYMMTATPSKMALWDTLNPDVPQLLSIFDDYLRSE